MRHSFLDQRAVHARWSTRLAGHSHRAHHGHWHDAKFCRQASMRFLAPACLLWPSCLSRHRLLARGRAAAAESVQTFLRDIGRAASEPVPWPLLLGLFMPAVCREYHHRDAPAGRRHTARSPEARAPAAGPAISRSSIAQQEPSASPPALGAALPPQPYEINTNQPRSLAELRRQQQPLRQADHSDKEQRPLSLIRHAFKNAY